MPTREPDLAYRPLSLGLDWAVRLGATDCLVLGGIDEEVARELSTEFDECRVAAAAQRAMAGALHDGLYAFRKGTTWHGVLVSGGRSAGEPEEADSRSIEDSHLVVASYLWDASWATAAALAAGAKYEVGAYVRDVGTGRIGRIKSSRRVDPHVSYTITFDGQDSSLLEDSLVLVSGDPSDPRFWLNELPASAEQLAMTLTWTKLNHPLTDTLYSFASSKTIFRPYQFKPVLKLLSSSVGRMLIADEVGLGKTIEAGLIWNELDQREPIRRALVVVPSNLVEKWRSELDRRFDRKLQLLKAQDLHEFATQLSLDPPMR